MSVKVRWVKSSESSESANCVEVAVAPDGAVLVRNSRHPLDGWMRYTPQEWDAFLAGAAAGEFTRERLTSH
jgi:hypothetical protein